MKIAKVNVRCGNKRYFAGQKYSDKEVAHLDQNDFETVETKSPKKTVKKATTKKVVKKKVTAKKKTTKKK